MCILAIGYSDYGEGGSLSVEWGFVADFSPDEFLFRLNGLSVASSDAVAKCGVLDHYINAFRKRKY